MENNGVSPGLVIGVYLFMFVIWAALGLWGGKLAQGKGYSFWLGFVAGFFGGIVGIIVLYVIKPARRESALLPPYPAPGRYRQTPPAQYGPSPEPPTEQGPARSKVCGGCQNLIPVEARFCTYCGADVSGTPTR